MSGEVVLRGSVQLTLDELADEIRRELFAAEADWRSAVGHALRAGELLIEAKAQVKYGEWLLWLDANFPESVRTADLYMRLARNSQRVANLPSIREAVALLAEPEDGAHVSHNAGENEWYTPPEYIAAARAVMGGVDLDPASTLRANEIVGAARIFTLADDGLGRPWRGRIWLNPPYAQPFVADFCAKLIDSYYSGAVDQACALVNNATETEWFYGLASMASAFCFPKGRVRFWHPERKSAPLQGQAVVYLGPRPDDFREAFGGFGFTVRA